MFIKKIIKKYIFNRGRNGLQYLSGSLQNYSVNQKCAQSSFFISTPIFYVNAVPHIGHLYTTVLADALARWQRLHHKDVIFSTGTDEHGLKIQQAADKDNMSPSDFCDLVSSKFKEIFQESNISYTNFIRTTEDRHKESVQIFWTKLENNGYIYKGSYKGWYSTSDEAFLTDDQVTVTTDAHGNTIRISVESGQPVEWMSEDNYMFGLSQFHEQLNDWINSGVVRPKKFENVVKGWLKEGLPDLSVSRQRDRLRWGIPVPRDDTQTVYVWLDALVNYLTVACYPDSHTIWPANCQVIGKDILKFHAIYWPAFLLACDLPLPKCLLVHSHWTVDNVKMSKSRGNVVDPMERLKMFTPDAFRYFLLKEGVPHSDGNYNDKKAVECINSDLVNTLGNLLSRCTSSAVNPDQIVPAFKRNTFNSNATADCQHMLDHIYQLPDMVRTHFEEYNIYKGLECTMEQLRLANRFFAHHKPWELVKQPDQLDWLNCVLSVSLEQLRICGLLLQPVIPNLADKLLTRLAVEPTDRFWNNTRSLFSQTQNYKLGPHIVPLIERLKYP